MSSRVGETLIFEKSRFSFWYRFLLIFGFQKHPKMDPKSMNKSINTTMPFTFKKQYFLLKQGAQMGSQRGPKT